LVYPPSQEETLSRLVSWGESQPLVRAMILTSTRAIPGSTSDAWSDYDVILALSDVRPFYNRRWLEAFGKVLVMYQDPLETDGDLLRSGNVVQFEGGLKIDFTLMQTEELKQIAAAPRLPAEYDAGYLLLLDKDGLADGLKPPTYKAYIPAPPTPDQYFDMVEGALLDATYVAKYLRRGDLMAARHVLVTYLVDEHLRPLLEWHYEIDHGWKVKPGNYGRYMQRWLRADLWADLECTFAGPGLAKNWEALFNALALMRKAAREVAASLDLTYPEEMVRKAMDYLQSIKTNE